MQDEKKFVSSFVNTLLNLWPEAHVGVGIYGREGHAAAQAADFSVSQFRHLQRVFLVHGHWYYNRLAFLVQYSFYKQVKFIFKSSEM
jgi:phospholipid-translocating ATPase